MSGFRLFQAETHFWSFVDHRAVLDVMAELQPKRVVEFGPGSSTLALVEGGAERIDSCEDDPEWFAVYEDRLAKRFPGVVMLRPYTMTDPVYVPLIDAQHFDLGLVDGPHNPARRLPVIEWCLKRCRAVLVPTEDRVYSLRAALVALAASTERPLRMWDTGPLSGGFALFTEAAC